METKYMEAREMARLGCGDCDGCSECCRGMGSSILIDPYDALLLKHGLNFTLERLLDGYLELQIHDGLILPSLVMCGSEEICVFLGDNGRCGIHDFRPGLCRLFPLGRDYSLGNLRYFMLEDACRKESRSKVKIEKWLAVPQLGRYECFLTDWHFLLKDLRESVPMQSGEGLKRMNMALLQLFYEMDVTMSDFYEEMGVRMARMRDILNDD